MARYVDAIDLPVPIGAAFDFLADFSRTAEWDPGVSSAERLDAGRIRRGSRFRIVVSFLGRHFPLDYEIAEMDRPRRLVLAGGDRSLRAVDEITFVERPGGTRISYEAQLELSGVRRLADPLLHLLFQRVGRLAVRGLRERMARGDVCDSPARAPSTRGTRPQSRAKSARARGTSARTGGVER